MKRSPDFNPVYRAKALGVGGRRDGVALVAFIRELKFAVFSDGE